MVHDVEKLVGVGDRSGTWTGSFGSTGLSSSIDPARQDHQKGRYVGLGPMAATEAVRSLIERLQPAVPIIAANLASVAPVLVTYRPDLDQLLVLLPQGIADVQAIGLAN